MIGASFKLDPHPHVSDRHSNGSGEIDNGSRHIPY